jgi:hypothetical protein
MTSDQQTATQAVSYWWVARVAERHIRETYAELGRIEAKAAGLLMVGVAALTVLAAFGRTPRLPLAAHVLGGMAEVTTAIAVGAVILALRPRLARSEGASWVDAADADPAELAAAWGRRDPETLRQAAESRVTQAIHLAGFAGRKHRLIRLAADMLLGALALTLLAAAVT